MTPWVMWSVGVLAFASGLGVVARSLFWDRARGRRRCPKCWYSMEGLAAGSDTATCPECGLSVKRASSLLRTRRHWRVAAVGVIVMVLSVAVVSVPFVRAKHWYDISPDTPLLLTLRQDPKTWSGATNELYNRAAKGNLWNWQERIVIDNLTASLESTTDELYQRPPAFWLGRIGPSAQSAAPALIQVLSQTTDYGMRLAAIEALGRLGDKRATPLLIAIVEDADSPHRITAVRALGQLKDPAAVATLCGALGHLRNSDDQDGYSPLDDVRNADEVILALGLIGAPLERTDDVLYLKWMTESGSAINRVAARACIEAIGSDETGFPTALAAIARDGPEEDRTYALACLMTLRTEASPVVDQMVELLDDPDANIRSYAVSVLSFVGRSGKAAIPRLDSLMGSDPDSGVQNNAEYALDRLR